MLNKRRTFYIWLALFCCAYWVADSLWSFVSFEENLSALIVTEPRSLFDTLLLKVSPYQLVSRLMVTVLFLLSGATVYELFAKKQRAEKAFRESEQKYRAVFDHANEGMLIVQKETIRLVNPKVIEIMGISEHQLVDTGVMEYIHPNDRNEVRNLFDKWLIHRTGHLSYSFRVISKKRDTIWVQVNTTPIKWEGSPAVLVLLTDISEERKLTDRLKRAEKMEALGLLAGGVAHDLNNILGGLVSYPDLLLMDLPHDSPLRDPILTMQKSGKRAAEIVQDLLTLARRDHAVSDAINLNDVVEDYMASPEFVKMTNHHPHVSVEVDLEPKLMNMLGSAVHLSKTLMNLCQNAAEACPNGGVIRITTENRHVDYPLRRYDEVRQGDYIVLSVKDNGQGIPGEDLDRIFEPFYTKKIMGFSGTGLGMAVVWGTVKDHKGYIDVDSGPGEGTVFDLYFPATRKQMEDMDIPMGQSDLKGCGERILVVDDMEDQRRVCSLILSRLGYDVAVAASGEEAVDYMASHSADLVILDMIMEPGIDGLETYKRIITVHPGQKALIASGFSETRQVEELQRLGAGRYIRKPYTLERLGVSVKAELAGNRKPGDLRENCFD